MNAQRSNSIPGDMSLPVALGTLLGAAGGYGVGTLAFQQWTGMQYLVAVGLAIITAIVMGNAQGRVVATHMQQPNAPTAREFVTTAGGIVLGMTLGWLSMRDANPDMVVPAIAMGAAFGCALGGSLGVVLQSRVDA